MILGCLKYSEEAKQFKSFNTLESVLSSCVKMSHAHHAREISQISNALQDAATVQEEAKASLPPASDAIGENACRIRVRFPDGSNLTSNFLKTHTLKTLRTFCIASSLEAASGRQFNLLQAGRGTLSNIKFLY